MKTHYELPNRLARAAHNKACDEIEANHRKGIYGEGDPNHPKYNNGYDYANPTLFGYAQKEFMGRQYK